MIDFNTAKKQRASQYKPPPPNIDPVHDFKDHLLKFKLDPGDIVPDGNIQRFDVDKSGDKAGWYVFYQGDICGAAFGNWKEGVKQNWCSHESSQMSDDQSREYQEKIKQAEIKRKKEEEKNHNNARKSAIQRLDNAKDPDPNHPYLKKKNIQAHGCIKQEGDLLLIPIKDISGKIHSVQEIHPDGKKHFPFGINKKGNFFTIKGNENIYICEGYATGATIYEATGGTVVIAFDAGNLLQVAISIKDGSPIHNITICADNDQFKPGNPGLTAGEKAAKKINAALCYPAFKNLSTKPTDFNDLASLEGIEAVKNHLKMDKPKSSVLPPFSDSDTIIKGRLTVRPPPKEFILKYNEQGLIPRGIVGVLTATGGTGKTYFILKLASTVSGGDPFGPITATRPIKTLILCGEDDQDELDRRLWDINHGRFPSLLHASSVYGNIGPLMRLDGNTPARADSFYWLEETIKRHNGLELLLIDPKSRFYGLDENNNDHATQWIQCLEFLSNSYGLTIIFTHHSPKDSKGINQGMGRGASAIIDGCRWQGGLVRMDRATGERYDIEDIRKYICFDIPKSNYAEDLPAQAIFKRCGGGVLEYTDPKQDRIKEMGLYFLKLMKHETVKYAKLDLIKEAKGKEFSADMKDKFPSFKRGFDMENIINYLLDQKKIYESYEETGKPGPSRIVLFLREN